MLFQIYGQQDRYSLSLKSTQMSGGYQTSSKVYLPPSNYSYSDTGMFLDEDSSECGLEWTIDKGLY